MFDYYKTVQFGDVTASIDMIRIEFKFKGGTYYAGSVFETRHGRLRMVKPVSYLEYFYSWLSPYSADIHYDYYRNSSLYRYKDLYKFQLPDGAGFTVGVGLNALTDAEPNSRKGFIEFNPNKCLTGWQYVDPATYEVLTASNAENFNKIWDLICELSDYHEVVRFDAAFDVPVPRRQVLLKKDSRKYQMYDSGADNYTESLGMRNTGNYVKIYNKTAESELSYDLTRIEFTVEPNVYESFLASVPEIYITRKNGIIQGELKDLKDTESVLVELLLKLEPTEREKYFRRLSYHVRKKLKAYVFGGIDTERFEVPQHVYYELMKIAMEFNKQRKVKINKEDENDDEKRL